MCNDQVPDADDGPAGTASAAAAWEAPPAGVVILIL